MTKIGDILKGKVVKIFKKGAIVQIPPGEDAFLPIGEVSNEGYVRDGEIERFIKWGQEVQVAVIGKNKKFNQWTVSLKQGDTKAVFEDKLKRFLKDSGDTLSQLQKNKDRKNGAKKKPIKPL
jgi:small subunit ribosomal protein S1